MLNAECGMLNAECLMPIETREQAVSAPSGVGCVKRTAHESRCVSHPPFGSSAGRAFLLSTAAIFEEDQRHTLFAFAYACAYTERDILRNCCRADAGMAVDSGLDSGYSDTACRSRSSNSTDGNKVYRRLSPGHELCPVEL